MKNLEFVTRVRRKWVWVCEVREKVKMGGRSNEKSIDGAASLPAGQIQYGSEIWRDTRSMQYSALLPLDADNQTPYHEVFPKDFSSSYWY
jgi:hypothetical protein